MPSNKRDRSSILVVDDELPIRQIIQKILTREGYRVVMAKDGQAALTCLGKRRFDCLVVDVKMPGVDGLELLRRAQSLLKDVPVILLTAYGTAASAREAMALGVYEFVAKPFDNKLLTWVVKEAMSGRK